MDAIDSLKKMLASGEPEVEPLKSEVPITESIDFEKPSAQRRCMGGTQKIWRFKNGFGASVVKHLGSYGGLSGLWELAVLQFDAKGDWHLTYETPITDDVLGHLSEVDVVELLQKIKALEA